MKLKLLSIALAATFTLVGCQGNDNNDTQEGVGNKDNNIEQTRFNDDINNNRSNRMNDPFDRMNDNNQNNRMDNDNRDNRMDNNRNNDNNQGNNKDRYDVSEKAANKITKEIDEIDQAYVITTDNNAYVAAVLDNNKNNNNTNTNKSRNNNDGDELTDEVKKKISDIVQSEDKDIDKVFVTTNPDFADLTTDYVNDVNDGNPITGFFDQMGNMIERVFPQNKR